MFRQQGNITLWLMVLLGVLVLSGGVYFYSQKLFPTPIYPVSPENPVMCTQEAKICPDGSSVGRTGPNCEFAACPVSSNGRQIEGRECGGDIENNMCPIGYECYYKDPKLATVDGTGVCKKK